MKFLTSRFCCLMLLGLVAGCGASLGGSPPAPPVDPLVGVWKGKDPFGQAVVLTLKKDGRLTLQITGERRSFTKQGNYTVDTSHSPAHFNIKLADRGEIRTICRLVDENHLAFESINSSDPRPKEFGNGRIVLERK